MAADEGDGAAGAGGVGAANAGAQREILDAAELLGVLLAEFAEFHQQGKALVAFFFFGRALE